MWFLKIVLLKKRLKLQLLILKLVSKLILWTLSSEKRRKRTYALLKPVIKLYGKILVRTMRGVYGVALQVIAFFLSYIMSRALHKKSRKANKPKRQTV